jgi:putative CocE/NonD family hydrolase
MRRPRRIHPLAPVLLFLLFGLLRSTSAKAGPSLHAISATGDNEQQTPSGANRWRRYNIVIERDVPARMRDGVSLYADIYRPSDPGQYAALLMRTPYNKTDAVTDFVIDAVKHGYVVALQDVRGQYRSEGEFNPYLQEINDGYDSIEWLAAQPYVNGKIGTFGLSYPGADQWMTAVTRPPHLAAMVPAMTFANSRHFLYQGGIFEAPILAWYLQRQAKARRQRGLPYSTIEEARAAISKYFDEWVSYVPLDELPLMKNFPLWKEWIDHPDNGPYWAPYDIESQYSKVQVPCLNVTAWNDDDYGQPGATRNFVGMEEHGGSEVARRGQRLLIGPWTHGIPTLGRTTFGGIDFGPNAGINYTETLLRFFDYWLKGIDDGYSQEAPVRYFVMGENIWRDAQDWPPLGTKPTDWMLGGGGRLSLSPSDDSKASFVYDPRNPLRAPGEGVYYAGGPGSPDWRSVTNRRDVLVFTSEPVKQDTEITGQILAHLWFSSSAPDTDVSMRLLDVWPEGNSVNLTAAPGMLRARYRSTEHETAPMPLKAGQPVELEISLGYTSYVIRAGHRLQVYIGGSIYPYVNPNTWEPFRSWTQAVPATDTVYFGSRYKSRITVPIMPH